MPDGFALDTRQSFSILVAAADSYIRFYPAPAEKRQQLYERIFAWCVHMAEQYGIPHVDSFLSDLHQPMEIDSVVTLVKSLHARAGVTKRELEELLGISSRSIQTNLRRLSGEGEQPPLRIGGQAVAVPVERIVEEGQWDQSHRFYTPNTMSPVIFQLNLMQAATLLQSFQCNYQVNGNNIPLDMAIDTWCQLSDYVKERIQEVFCERDSDFKEFLDLVAAEAGTDTYRFMTESELLARQDVSRSELLLIADKGRRICDIALSGPYRTRKNQRIVYDHVKHGYYAVAADNLGGERLYFAEDEVKELVEVPGPLED